MFSQLLFYCSRRRNVSPYNYNNDWAALDMDNNSDYHNSAPETLKWTRTELVSRVTNNETNAPVFISWLEVSIKCDKRKVGTVTDDEQRPSNEPRDGYCKRKLIVLWRHTLEQETTILHFPDSRLLQCLFLYDGPTWFHCNLMGVQCSRDGGLSDTIFHPQQRGSASHPTTPLGHSVVRCPAVHCPNVLLQ